MLQRSEFNENLLVVCFQLFGELVFLVVLRRDSGVPAGFGWCVVSRVLLRIGSEQNPATVCWVCESVSFLRVQPETPQTVRDGAPTV